MPKYRVMCYRQGVWDGQDARIVEAETERDAAEPIIGEGLVEGPDRLSGIYVKVGLTSRVRNGLASQPSCCRLAEPATKSPFAKIALGALAHRQKKRRKAGEA